MKPSLCRPISLQDAATGKRIRVSRFEPGTCLQALTNDCTMPVLGYWHRENGMTAYVPGVTPAAMRTAVELQRTHEEVLLVPELPAGISELELEDLRYDYCVVIPMRVDADALTAA